MKELRRFESRLLDIENKIWEITGLVMSDEDIEQWLKQPIPEGEPADVMREEYNREQLRALIDTRSTYQFYIDKCLKKVHFK